MSDNVTMWAINFWQDVPTPEQMDVIYRTVPERSYYGYHHGYGHTVYVAEDSVFKSPLDAAAAWYTNKRKYWARIRAETDQVLAELMPDIFEPGWENGDT